MMYHEETLRDAQAGLPGAMDALLDAWLPVVMGWCLRLGASPVDAEDLTHEVFLIVFRKVQSLREPRAFPAWLYGITRRVLAAHRRKAWFRRWLPGVEPTAIDPNPTPLDAAQTSEVAQQVWEALSLIPDKHREVLVLCDLEERADSEVAAMLGVPKGTVKSRLRRARANLRSLVPELAADILSLSQDQEESA